MALEQKHVYLQNIKEKSIVNYLKKTFQLFLVVVDGILLTRPLLPRILSFLGRCLEVMTWSEGSTMPILLMVPIGVYDP